MTSKGDRTKARLVEAARSLVVESGYTQATTRAIAERAGVSEATIYRHFPDKRALFVTALLESHEGLLAWMADLPARAGTAPLAQTLSECLLQLSELRASIVPMEHALREDADDERRRPSPGSAMTLESAGGPPALLAQYLAEERRLGRIRADVNPEDTAVLLLALLGGLAMGPPALAERLPDLIASGVRLLLAGLAAESGPAPG